MNDKLIKSVIENVKATSQSDAQTIEKLYTAYLILRARLSSVTESRDWYQRQLDLKTFTGL